MMTVAEVFFKKYFILWLEKEIVPGWLDRVAQKVAYFIIFLPFEYFLEVLVKKKAQGEIHCCL